MQTPCRSISDLWPPKVFHAASVYLAYTRAFFCLRRKASIVLGILWNMLTSLCQFHVKFDKTERGVRGLYELRYIDSVVFGTQNCYRLTVTTVTPNSANSLYSYTLLHTVFH